MEEDSGSGIVWVAVGLLLVAIIGVAIWFFGFKNKKEDCSKKTGSTDNVKEYVYDDGTKKCVPKTCNENFELTNGVCTKREVPDDGSITKGEMEKACSDFEANIKGKTYATYFFNRDAIQPPEYNFTIEKGLCNPSISYDVVKSDLKIGEESFKWRPPYITTPIKKVNDYNYYNVSDRVFTKIQEFPENPPWCKNVDECNKICSNIISKSEQNIKTFQSFQVSDSQIKCVPVCNNGRLPVSGSCVNN
jgi:hypothetical protein